MRPEARRTDDTPTATRPTLRDVARESRLSVTQTSRALNGHTDVAAATRQRVLDAAQRIGYSPNIAARRLKNPDARSHSIGLVLTTASQRFSDPWFGGLLADLVGAAAANGYELQLTTPLADEDPVASYQRAIQAKRVDGFVLLRTANEDRRVEYLSGTALPFVTFGEPRYSGDHPSVSDSLDCMQPAVDHLVSLGHRRIACVAEPLDYALATRRHRSFLSALESNRIDPDPRYVVIGGYREEAGFEATHQLLDLEDPPTAVVAFNDLLAIGAIGAAIARGIEVPRQFSIVGFDDIHAARYTSPPLTTLRNPTEPIGRSLIQQLLRAIDGQGTFEPIHLKPELVIRESTGPVPS